MSALRHYITGTDGTTPGLAGCPFNMDKVQKDYVDGSITATKIINFGETENKKQLSTNIDIECTPLGSSNGKQILDVVAYSGFYETSTLNFRTPNLHKPGAARASDVWVAIPDNIIVPHLIQKLHQGAIDHINIGTLAFIENDTGRDIPTVVQSIEYDHCFVKCVDPLSYGELTVFSFSFVKVTIRSKDVNQISGMGKNDFTETGTYVYEINYNSTDKYIGSKQK